MDIISSLPLSTILNSGFALTSGRIARIIQARTLEDASHMGLVDRLFDKFLRKGGQTRGHRPAIPASQPARRRRAAGSLTGGGGCPFYAIARLCQQRVP